MLIFVKVWAIVGNIFANVFIICTCLWNFYKFFQCGQLSAKVFFFCQVLAKVLVNVMLDDVLFDDIC